MANYYFLATLLPPLKIGSPPDISSKELDYLFGQNLLEEDFEKVRTIRFLKDIENIGATLQNAKFETGGNLDTAELQRRVELKEGLPEYVLAFLDLHEAQVQRIEHFPELLKAYFDNESKTSSEFISDYLQFEWQWRIVFVALRAKELNRDIGYELRHEDPYDPFIAQIIAQGEAASFEPPSRYVSLKALFESRKHAPLELYKALAEWRFEQVQEMIDWQFFSIIRILGYVIQLQICEKWLELNKEEGIQILQELVER